MSSIWYSGELRLNKRGELVLHVPNALVQGQFAALAEMGVSLPVNDAGKLDASILVMSAKEVAGLGAVDIDERGKHFKYKLGALFVVDGPRVGISKLFALRVVSPELHRLRKSYGLSSVPSPPLQLPIAVRKRNVLREGAVTKAAYQSIGATAKVLLGLHKLAAPTPPPVFAQQLRKAVSRIKAPVSTAQAEAGNYRKGHLNVHGMSITLETEAGQRRKPEWPPLKNHYGYVRRVYDPSSGAYVTVGEAADGDHVDVFIGDDLDSHNIYVVDQVDPKTGKFDEHKVLIGWSTMSDAREGYKSNYSSDWRGLGKITRLTLAQFKEWLADGDKKSPIAEQSIASKPAQEKSTPQKRTRNYEAPDADVDENDEPVVLIMQRSIGVRIISPTYAA